LIVPMKKATLLVLSSRAKAAVAQLRNLGLLHLVITQTQSTDVKSLQERVTQVERALSVLPATTEDAAATLPTKEEAEAIISRIFAINQDIKTVRDQLASLEREEANLREWGQFDPAVILELNRKGISISLAILSKKQLEGLAQEQTGVLAFPIRSAGSLVHTALVGKLPEKCDFSIFPLPSSSLSEVRQQIDQAKQQLSEQNNLLAEASQQQARLELYKAWLLKHVESAEVEASLEEHGTVVSITGYLPAEKAGHLKSYAKQHGWGLILSDPGPDDEVPTLTRNSRFVSIIQPVFDILGTVPGYYEQDISSWFLLFFCFFFAMIIGDAGYGMIMFLGGWAVLSKQRKQGSVSAAPILLMLLSGATVIWGSITGNWFGYAPIAQLPGFRSLVIPALNSFNPRSVAAVQKFCFILGTTQIALAHFLSMLKYAKNRQSKAIAEFGWMCLVLALYYVVLNVVISATSYPIPSYVVPVIVISMLLVLLFQNQEGDSFLKGILRSLGDFIPTALSGVSSFSDIISYIRLFAVGLAGIEIAKSFNAMATDIMQSGALGVAAGILVVLFGHSLNLAMAALSVMVHGVRLNMLEFSNHVGNQWAGFAYKPFGENENNTDTTSPSVANSIGSQPAEAN
jgi:V/A-type H+-transporting ATPase subunit I